MIKNNLPKILGDKCITISKLARMTGLGYAGLYRLTRRQTTQIEFATIDKICDALEISVGELFEHVKN